MRVEVRDGRKSCAWITLGLPSGLILSRFLRHVIYDAASSVGGGKELKDEVTRV